MANVGIPHRRRQLDLYRDDLAVQSLDDKIDLPVPSRCAQVPDPGAVDLSCNRTVSVTRDSNRGPAMNAPRGLSRASLVSRLSTLLSFSLQRYCFSAL